MTAHDATVTLLGHPLASWLAFAATLAVVLGMELGVMSRIRHLTVRQVAWWSAAVIGLAALFAGVLWAAEGASHALLFSTGYVIEFALSVDNLLVFMIILEYFAVPETAQPTVLNWGILGAIVTRAAMIGVGTWALAQAGWLLLVLGGLLVVTGARMMGKPADATVDIARNPLLRAARRVLPISDRFEGRTFFTRHAGRLLATPLLLVVLAIEWTDVMFATDSIPAIFAITRDPFLVYTANILAVVGLRALYFLLASMISRFAYVRYGVATVLVLIGAKMLASRWFTPPTGWLLLTIVVVLGVSLGASWRRGET
jgi:tellurite resistance protein TerC